MNIVKNSLIANSGIQFISLSFEINKKDKYELWFHEWYDKANGQWKLEPVHELRTDDSVFYFNKKTLYDKGYLLNLSNIGVDDLRSDGIYPLRIDDEMAKNVSGKIFRIKFDDKECLLNSFTDVWLPIPYFKKKSEKRLEFGPLNWSRAKFTLKSDLDGIKKYDVLLAFDTRTKYVADDYKEFPVFEDQFTSEMDFTVCNKIFSLMDYCSAGEKWSYVDKYLFNKAHPDLQDVSKLKGDGVKMSYIATYLLLIDYIANQNKFPAIKLYKDTNVELQDVDMVVDIGNSKTTALLLEGKTNFNQVRMLNLIDFTTPLVSTKDTVSIHRYDEPFDMRIAFRRVDFGNFGVKNSKQFVYPSLVRLGKEANVLIHHSSNNNDGKELLSTYSSPKRFLWDWRPNKEEWRFLLLNNEVGEGILNIPGITNQLESNGKVSLNGLGGVTYHYSRRSLMTFSFLEMLVQARTQINSCEYRSNKTGFGRDNVPRQIKRLIITCPTAMSKVERTALIQCAKDATILLDNFEGDNGKAGKTIEIVPAGRLSSDEQTWYYDEATCAQLVYLYGEIGYKYRGCSREFFNLYGKIENNENQPSLTVASLDIGAGTSDLMISKISYQQDNITTITPEPKFYDSYYFAGDEMLKAFIENIMLLDEDNSAIIQGLKDLREQDPRQKVKDFFGRDYNGQTLAERTLRKDFNLQYSVPLMYYFLDLLSKDSNDCVVRFNDVFDDCPPNENVTNGFKQHLGLDLTKLEWSYKKEIASQIVKNTFEPLFKKIATIMYSYACDIILLSGRPASLTAIRDIFLKYYTVSPNRLIVLNNYYVGDWFPFGNNTGYITNPKTIVAMGAVIAHYTSELTNLNNFTINLDKLKGNLKSTVNYIAPSRDAMPNNYFITPDIDSGQLVISTLPESVRVRQIGLDTYPYRTLYTIDYNRYKMIESERRKNSLNDDYITDAGIITLVNEKIDALNKKMPFTIEIERDADDQEKLMITSVEDRNGNKIADNYLEIHIQSLGVNDKYWLDTGEFDF